MTVATSGIVKEQECSSAKELLEALDPSRKELWGASSKAWLFRGHENSTYELRPSALRAKCRLLWGDKWEVGPRLFEEEQQQAEFNLVRRFFRLADVQGLPIPGDSSQMRELMLRSKLDFQGAPGKAVSVWPSPEAYSLLALAQHYGVSTRLLDWSRKPLVAAYFAAVGAAREYWEKTSKGLKPGWEHLSLWALRRREQADEDEDFLMRLAKVQIIYVPRSENPNLHLQSGAFTLVTRSEPPHPRQETDLRTLDEVLAEAVGRKAVSQPLLRHFKLPISEAPRLLALLRDHFVQAATIYAGYRGVAESVFEHQYRRLP